MKGRSMQLPYTPGCHRNTDSSLLNFHIRNVRDLLVVSVMHVHTHELLASSVYSIDGEFIHP